MGQNCCRSLRQSLVGPMALNKLWVIGMGKWGSWDVSQCWSRGVSLFCFASGVRDGAGFQTLVQMMVDRMLKPKLQCLVLADLDLKEEENTNWSWELWRS